MGNKQEIAKFKSSPLQDWENHPAQHARLSIEAKKPAHPDSARRQRSPAVAACGVEATALCTAQGSSEEVQALKAPAACTKMWLANSGLGR